MISEFKRNARARIWEKKGIFPYKLITSNMCTININNNRLFLDSIKLGNIDAKIHFFNGMIDYPIEKEIYNSNQNYGLHPDEIIFTRL